MFERPDQPVQELPDLRRQFECLLHIRSQQPRGQLELGFELCLGPERDGQVIQKDLAGATVVPFGDVGGNGHRGSSDLLRESEPLTGWKASRDLITRFGKLHGSLPGVKVAE